jgi:hypothetical protein
MSAWSHAGPGTGDDAGAYRLPDITDVQRLELRPGDRLIVRLEHAPTPSEVRRVCAIVRQLLEAPQLPVLVLGPHETVKVLHGDGSETG